MSNRVIQKPALDLLTDALIACGCNTGTPPRGWGKNSKQALLDLASDFELDLVQIEFPSKPRVKASSFADLKDVAAFKRCKGQGKTDQECFKVGDNGIGKWMHNTAQDKFPMAALPPEVWQAAKKSGGARLAVTYKGKRVEGILGDTMPKLANIKNGAGIDLNPAFAKELGVLPPFMIDVSWEWI